MTRLRTSMLMLGICVAAIIIGVLRLATQPAPQPTGSSYSSQPDGALALYSWLDELGAPIQRIADATVDPSVSALLVLQPASVIDSTTRASFDAVADRGGTLVLAGDSIPWLVYTRALGVTVQPISAEVSTVTGADGLELFMSTRYAVSADDAQPLLNRDDGKTVGLRVQYRNGSLVVIASPEPFTNAALADPDTARFVFRQVLSPIGSSPVAFDEINRSPIPTGTGPTTLNQLLFRTPPGVAVIYLCLLTFVFLWLGGRRLGPPLPAPSAAASQRTMYEHVQMLANLYRRAGQLEVVRASFSRHFTRELTRGTANPRRAAAVSEALVRMQSARSEADLVSAVAATEETT